MPAETRTVQPAVFYLTEWGGVQTSISPLNLMRYDLLTGQTTRLLSFSEQDGSGAQPQVELSPDKHWLLIMDNNPLNRLQLIRTDGTQMQTLACGNIASAHWLPGGQQIALTRGQYDQQRKVVMNTVDVLDLTNGQTRTVLSGAYSPSSWLDDHRLIVETLTNNIAQYYLFDTNNGSQQKLTNLPRIASLPALLSAPSGYIASSSDSSRIFISSFTKLYANCQGPVIQGPGTLTSYTINDGSTHTLYADQHHAITMIQPVDAHTLLISIENTVGDLSQNGLWKIKSDGTGLTRLTRANDPRCRDISYEEWAPQIAQNGQSYTLLQTDFTHNIDQSIVVGNLSGGTPTTIATSANVALPRGKAYADKFLQLVGMR
jgi:hypothetical protein